MGNRKLSNLVMQPQGILQMHCLVLGRQQYKNVKNITFLTNRFYKLNL